MEQLRPPSSVSLLADQLQLSSLNETIPEEKTRLISVDQTAIHRRRLSNHDRRLAESTVVASSSTVSIHPPGTSIYPDGSHPSACFCQPERLQLESEKENSNAERISPVATSNDSGKLYSISAPTPVFLCKPSGFTASYSPTSASFVGVTYPSSAPFRRYPSTALTPIHCTSHCACCLATSHHIPAKRVCRPFSATSSINHLHLCTMCSNYNDIHLLETHRSTLPRPVALRMTTTGTSSVEHVSLNRPFQFNTFEMSAPRCPPNFNQTSQFSCKHFPLSKENSSQALPINTEVCVISTCDGAAYTSCSIKSSTSAHGSDITELLRKPLNAIGSSDGVKQVGTSLPICLACGSESDASNSSGVDSLLCHYSAFTPTRVLPNDIRDDPLPQFNCSRSSGIHSVSSSVPLSAPTPSSGFHEMSYFPNVSSLPDCTKGGFRFNSNVCADKHELDRHDVLRRSQRLITTDPSGSPRLHSRLSHCDHLLRCWSHPTSIENNPAPVNSPLETLSEAAPDSRSSPHDPTETMTAGLKRRWRKCTESEVSIFGQHPCTCGCRMHECLAHKLEIEPTCDVPQSSDWKRSPVHPSPGESSNCDVFVFGPYLSNWGNGLFHEDGLHGSHTLPDSRPGMRAEWKPPTNRDVCTSCKSFTFDSDMLPCRHIHPQLTDLSELAEEDKDNETPECVLEDTGGTSNYGWEQSRYPTVTSPSVFEVTFEPISTSCDSEGHVDEVAPSVSVVPSESADQSSRSANHNLPDILIPLSSPDSDDLNDEVVLSPRLIGRQRPNVSDTGDTCDAPPIIQHVDIDLELMENN